MAESSAIFFDNNVNFDDDNDDELKQVFVHLRVFQRKTRKYITTIEGLEESINLKKIMKYMRKTYNCNGNIKNVEKGDVTTKVIQLQGDKREDIKKFLISENIVPEKLIKVHGF